MTAYTANNVCPLVPTSKSYCDRATCDKKECSVAPFETIHTVYLLIRRAVLLDTKKGQRKTLLIGTVKALTASLLEHKAFGYRKVYLSTSCNNFSAPHSFDEVCVHIAVDSL